MVAPVNVAECLVWRSAKVPDQAHCDCNRSAHELWITANSSWHAGSYTVALASQKFQYSSPPHMQYTAPKSCLGSGSEVLRLHIQPCAVTDVALSVSPVLAMQRFVVGVREGLGSGAAV